MTFTEFLVFSSEVELPWVTVVKAHAVHNTEIGKIVLGRSSRVENVSGKKKKIMASQSPTCDFFYRMYSRSGQRGVLM